MAKGLTTTILICLMLFSMPAAHAQTGSNMDSTDPCTYSNSAACQSQGSMNAPVLGFVVVCLIAGGIYGSYLFASGGSSKAKDQLREQREIRYAQQQSDIRQQEAADLANVTALVAQANQGMSGATNASVKVKGRVGSVEVTIETNKSSREEAEAKALGSLAQPMSNYTDL